MPRVAAVKTRRICFCLLLLTLPALVAPAWSCQVPVFRFALERWYPDFYRLSLTPGASGTLNPEETAVSQALAKALEPDGLSTNLVLVDPQDQNTGPGARMDLRYPAHYAPPDLPPVWSGPATRENARRLLDSPLRRELAKRLLAGDSTVWVLVEGGNAEADLRAEETLTQACEEAKREMTISEEVVPLQALEQNQAEFPADPDNLLRAAVPLKIDFSILRLSRKDPEEQVLLALLLHLEEDLAKLNGEPMAFPVFGRGRVLEPLIGAGIHRENVLGYAGYLCGACSCQVKDQNPGLDLLISAGWDAAISGSEAVVDKVLPPLEGLAALLGEPAAPRSAAAVQPAETSSAAQGQGAPSGSLRLPLVLAGSLGAILLVLVMATAVILLRMKRNA